jgi:hypothetical protein
MKSQYELDCLGLMVGAGGRNRTDTFARKGGF